MKKIFLTIILLIFMGSTAFAVENTGTLTLGGSDSPKFSCGLSNQVEAYYNTDGTTSAPAQWFVIGTQHIGGTDVFATAQDITSLYKLKDGKPSGEYFSWTGLPADSTDSATWSDDVWQQL